MFLRFVPEKRDCKGTHNFLIHKRFKGSFLKKIMNENKNAAPTTV